MTDLREHVQKRAGTQAEKAEALGITQPRLNDLLKGRIDKFSLDALVSLAQKAGLRVNVNVQPVQILPKPSSINRRLTTVPSTFAPHPSELGQLDSKQGTSLFLKLLRCEAIANGLSPKDVVLSSNTNAPDGGIDAKVDNSPDVQFLISQRQHLLSNQNRFGVQTLANRRLEKRIIRQIECHPFKETTWVMQ